MVALLSLGLMLVVSSACWLLRRRVRGAERRLLALLALLAGGIWLRSDQQVEGPVLWAMTKSHGITLSDLLVLIPLAAAVLTTVYGARKMQKGWPSGSA